MIKSRHVRANIDDAWRDMAVLLLQHIGSARVESGVEIAELVLHL